MDTPTRKLMVDFYVIVSIRHGQWHCARLMHKFPTKFNLIGFVMNHSHWNFKVDISFMNVEEISLVKENWLFQVQSEERGRQTAIQILFSRKLNIFHSRYHASSIHCLLITCCVPSQIYFSFIVRNKHVFVFKTDT